MDTPIALWAVVNPDGRILTHTITDCKAQSEENFRAGSYPRNSLEHWFGRGYRVVELEVYVKSENNSAS